MRRRNVIFALTVLVVAAVVPAHKDLWQVGSRSLHFLVALCQRKPNLSERQKRMDSANKDLMTIAQAELSHIQKRAEFAKLEELISSRELVPDMAGRDGYVYSIRLEGNAILTSAYPVFGQQLPAVLNSISGPRVTSILAKLQKEN